MVNRRGLDAGTHLRLRDFLELDLQSCSDLPLVTNYLLVKRLPA